MSRILTTLAVFAILLLLGNVYLGLTGGDYNGAATAIREQQREVSKLRSEALVDKDALANAEAELESGMVGITTLKERNGRHVLLGLLATLVTVMVNSIAVTYFIGTSRWCKEVSETYSLDPKYVQASDGQKKKTFPFALIGIMTVLCIAAFGAASDPGTYRETTGNWVGPHYIVAIAGILVIAWALYRQVIGIRRHQDIINEILAAVREIRETKGLATEPVDGASIATTNGSVGA